MITPEIAPGKKGEELAPKTARMSVEKQAGPAAKVKKNAVPNHTAAFKIPMNRKKPVTPERYGKRQRLPSLENGKRAPQSVIREYWLEL